MTRGLRVAGSFLVIHAVAPCTPNLDILAPIPQTSPLGDQSSVVSGLSSQGSIQFYE